MADQERTSLAFFLPTLEVGGTEKNVVNLVNSIDNHQYLVALVLGSKKGEFLGQVHPDIPVINLNAPYSLRLFFALIHFFKTYRPAIFVSAFPRINIICLAARFFSGRNTKIIITEHSVFSLLPVIAKTPWRRFTARFFVPRLAKWLYPQAQAVVCVSKGIADDIVKTLGSRQKISIIYNPVINDAMLKAAREPVDHPFFLEPKVPVILAVGRLVACKDYPTLLKAFERIVRKQPARLVILGNGPEKESLQRLAASIGLSQYIAFLGFQENPYRYMRQASVFALSSLQEGFGNVIIEAMACGLPVVSTDCPTGPGEIIEHMKNGILVPVGDWEALSLALLEVLQNPTLARQFSVEGKRRADFFSVTKSTSEYQKIFKALC